MNLQWINTLGSLNIPAPRRKRVHTTIVLTSRKIHRSILSSEIFQKIFNVSSLKEWKLLIEEWNYYNGDPLDLCHAQQQNGGLLLVQ